MISGCSPELVTKIERLQLAGRAVMGYAERRERIQTRAKHAEIVTYHDRDNAR